MKSFPISVVIPVYKNYEMFYRNLRSNQIYFDGCEILVMNDFPGENITGPVKEISPRAAVINNKINLGFAGNVNAGVEKVKNKYVFLINSDVVLRDDSFKKSLDLFRKDNKLFAIGFAQIEKDGKIVGYNRGFFRNGLISHSGSSLPAAASALFPNFWAEGGASIFRRDLFVGLGMLDPLYNPFYWEDVDLSYRAWKSGYHVAFAPWIKVEHRHESTIGKYFDRYKINRTAFRNQLIFQWKNLTDRVLLLKHLVRLPYYLFTGGFFDALGMLPAILKARKKALKLFVKSDKEVLDKFKN